MGSHRRHHGGGLLARCVSRRSTAPGDRRQLVRRNRADVAGEDVYLSALQRQQLGHHRALGRLRRAGDQLRTQHNQASRRRLAGELWLLGCWANMAGGRRNSSWQGRLDAGGQDQERTSRWRSYSLLLGQQMLTCSTMLSPSGVQVSTRWAIGAIWPGTALRGGRHGGL